MSQTVPSPATGRRAIRALAVVGTSGRGGDGAQIDRALYGRMAEALKTLLSQVGPVDGLVGGGDPVAGHLAVGFFLRGLVPALSLHLPANFSLSAACFVDPYAKSTGSIANYWHRRFSGHCGGNSLDAVGRAITKPGCVRRTHLGFEARNAGIAEQADAVVAFSFSNGGAVGCDDVGAVIERCLQRGDPAWHISLPSCEIFTPVTIPLLATSRADDPFLRHGGKFNPPCSVAA